MENQSLFWIMFFCALLYIFLLVISCRWTVRQWLLKRSNGPVSLHCDQTSSLKLLAKTSLMSLRMALVTSANYMFNNALNFDHYLLFLCESWFTTVQQQRSILLNNCPCVYWLVCTREKSYVGETGKKVLTRSIEHQEDEMAWRWCNRTF